MSCNGCRVLRRGCSDQCILRQSLEGIETPQAQANATLFVSKFFGRSDLMAFISAVPVAKRPALFQSLLFEACGRAVNPVSGSVGLFTSGNWHVCEEAVETVLKGGVPAPVFIPPPIFNDRRFVNEEAIMHGSLEYLMGEVGENMASLGSGLSELSLSPEIGNGGGGGGGGGVVEVGNKKPKLLNLFG